MKSGAMPDARIVQQGKHVVKQVNVGQAVPDNL